MPFVVKTNKEKSWIKYIRNRITNNKNFLCIFSGQTGGGKSWSAVSIAEQLDPDFTIERCVFYARDLLKLINSGKLKKGSVIVWDECSVDAGNRDWQSAVNKLINHLFTTFRRENLIIFFTTPYSDFVDSSLRKLFHAEFLVAGIDQKKGTCRIKPEHIQYNARIQKYYHKRLMRINPKSKLLSKISFWQVPKPSKELSDLYEAKKKKFTHELNKELLIKLNAIEEKQKPKQRLIYECPKCQYEWKATKSKNPKRCPECYAYHPKLKRIQTI